MFNDSPEVQLVARLAARDIRSNLGSNLRLIHDMTGLNPWTTTRPCLKEILRDVTIAEIPESDTWRLGFLKKLLSERQEAFYNADDEGVNNITSLIESLVIN